jgi:diamine N-acetyltransferase
VAELVPITNANWRDATAVRAGEGQLRFIAGYEPVALVILSKAFVRVGDTDWWPYLITDGGRPVGVLALVDERQRNGQVALFHLLVDAGHQRSGLGRAALRLVLERARRLSGCRRLRLTVHPDNRAAITLYLSEGFTQDGVADDGELCFSTSVS